MFAYSLGGRTLMRRIALTLVILTAACDAGVTSDGGAVPVPAPGKADAVSAGLPMITEYAEPSVGNNKAIELYNPLPFAVSMDDCSLNVFFNGGTNPRRISLQGVVMDPQSTAVVCHAGADDIEWCDLTSNSLAFNGNDAVALRCDFGGTDTTLDVFGVVGENPGSGGWEVGESRSRDVTLRRSCDVATGHDSFEPDQWRAAPANDFSHLGEFEPCEELEPACNQGEGVVGADADAIFGGEDPRFEVLVEDTIFGNFTPRNQELLLAAAAHFYFPDEEITDASSVVGAVARDGTGGIEVFSIRDNDSGLEYDALRYYANDATEHSVVFEAGGGEVAFSFDGELFGCTDSFCSDGDLTLPVFEGMDEDEQPDDRFEILARTVVLGDGARVRRVLRRGDDPTLLTAAFEAHGLDALGSTELLEQLARDNSGPLTYYFIAGPTEDLEGVVFHLDGGLDRGLLAVEDSIDPELVTLDGRVISCAPGA